MVRDSGDMTVIGYSDVINHALAFAAKHHDRQVRKGTKLPYLTQPANVAIILTRYGQGDSTVVAGILHDVVADWVRDGYSREMLEQRMGDKFGPGVLDTILSVTQRKHDDEGIDLSSEERRSDYLERLAAAGEEARWVCAADKVHHASTIVADLRRTVDPETVWNRFGGGRAHVVSWYRSVYERLREVGFAAPIMSELDRVTRDLEGMK
ncbi:MAG TPA: HD domain-containing protein [Gemmatimonadaceae bacterium]|nr:HD domain-containing protein [Gemmatimonadaceae bacterium]